MPNIMGKKKAKPHSTSTTIALNRKAKHDYTIEKRFEAGIVLTGWEIKSIRDHKVQIADSYVVLRKGEAWLLNSQVNPLLSASTHVKTEPTRSRKLLLHRKEISELIGHIERKGYTLIPLALYWKRGKVKLEIALAKGKKQYDKRHADKERTWKRDKMRLLKTTK